MIPWLEAGDPFPPVEQALRDPNGLLAAGDDLSTDAPAAGLRARHLPLVRRRRSGAVVESRPAHGARRPTRCKVSRSLRKTLRSGRFRVTADTAFPAVMRRVRRAAAGAGRHLDHPRGAAGLLRAGRARRRALDRGVGRRRAGRRAVRRRASGAMFFGESMFARRSRRVEGGAGAPGPAAAPLGLSADRLPDVHVAPGLARAGRTSAAPSSSPSCAATCRRRRSPAPVAARRRPRRRVVRDREAACRALVQWVRRWQAWAARPDTRESTLTESTAGPARAAPADVAGAAAQRRLHHAGVRGVGAGDHLSEAARRGVCHHDERAPVRASASPASTPTTWPRRSCRTTMETAEAHEFPLLVTMEPEAGPEEAGS